jgi:hypothetical protein
MLAPSHSGTFSPRLITVTFFRAFSRRCSSVSTRAAGFSTGVIPVCFSSARGSWSGAVPIAHVVGGLLADGGAEHLRVVAADVVIDLGAEPVRVDVRRQRAERPARNSYRKHRVKRLKSLLSITPQEPSTRSTGMMRMRLSMFSKGKLRCRFAEACFSGLVPGRYFTNHRPSATASRSAEMP